MHPSSRGHMEDAHCCKFFWAVTRKLMCRLFIYHIGGTYGSGNLTNMYQMTQNPQDGENEQNLS